jgi:Bacterial PH domain
MGERFVRSEELSQLTNHGFFAASTTARGRSAPATAPIRRVTRAPVSAHDPRVRELRPPVRSSAIRMVLAVLVAIVVIVPMGALLFLALSLGEPTLRVIAFVAAPLLIVNVLVMAAQFALGPSRMRYLVGDGSLEVRTLLGSKRWPTAGARARAYTPARVARALGTAGIPGYFAGRFRESGQSTRIYATELVRVVLFEGPERVIVSPEDRDEMLRVLAAEGVVVEWHTR